MEKRKNKVLIIDDDAKNIFALKATLKAKGFDCMDSFNAIEALKILKNTEVDIVLIDMMMPEMDGYEAIPTIRELKNKLQLPIISVTAQAMVGDKEKCLKAGADDYISKPINVDKLMELLDKYLQ